MAVCVAAAGRAGVADPAECVDSTDCERQIGARACGTWTCASGRCQATYDCTDADHDGFGTGADCACTGVTLDCDDGDAAIGASASVACCNGGMRACTAGVWGLCSGATGETCDGLDNDCNGVADDLGVITCGLGACKKTIPACVGGVLGVCIPDAPATTVDGCNGIDDDCDGTVDEDCPRCVHVAPDGDDTAAAASCGDTPFASVQAALDFADAHRELGSRVCVAAGPNCGDTATYSGRPGSAITMHEGISLQGGYESTGWTRCDDSVTHLAPLTSAGVLFPPGIAVTTALDGFTVDADNDCSLNYTAAVTVDGARGAVLSHLAIPTHRGAGPPYCALPGGDSVSVVHGGSARIVSSYVEGAFALQSTAVHATGATVFVENNCLSALDGATGRCTATCDSAASGPQIQGLGGDGATVATILLEDAAGSRVERSTVCGYLDYNDVSVKVTGRAGDVVIRGNTLGGGEDDAIAGLQLSECAGGAPWVVGNDSIGAQGAGSFDAVQAVGDCHPVIEQNRAIGSDTINPLFGLTGVHCAGGTVASRCVIRGNTIVGASESVGASYQAGARSFGQGVVCDDGSCGRIEDNSITGLDSNIVCVSGGCVRGGNGVVLSGGAPSVARNVIRAGFAPHFTGSAFTGTTSGAVAHNHASDFAGSAADFEWNDIAYVTWSGGGTASNNCMTTFSESNAASDPLVFTDNALLGAYVDEGTTSLTTTDAINALTDMTSSGNVVGPCPGSVGP